MKTKLFYGVVILVLITVCILNYLELRELRCGVDRLNSKLDELMRFRFPLFGESLRYQMELADSVSRIANERAMESSVKSNMHTLQLAAEDYKTSPGLEGITPKNVREIKMKVRFPRNLRNSYTGSQNFEDIFVDGWPKQPGQVGYLAPRDSAGIRMGYRIVGRGRKAYLDLILEEGF
jgi:hypothetical protein